METIHLKTWTLMVVVSLCSDSSPTRIHPEAAWTGPRSHEKYHGGKDCEWTLADMHRNGNELEVDGLGWAMLWLDKKRDEARLRISRE